MSAAKARTLASCGSSWSELVSVSTKHHRLQSWIPPSFAWTTVADVFSVKVPVGDPDVVEFVATGTRFVDLHRRKASAHAAAAIHGPASFAGQLEEAAWTVLRHTEDWKNRFAMAKVHCHGVFCLPGGRELLVLVSVNAAAAPEVWLPQSVRDDANLLLKEHQAKVVEFDDQIRRKRQSNEEIFSDRPDYARSKDIADTLIGMESMRPVVTADRLLPHLPKAATFPASASPRASTVERAATTAIVESGWPIARDNSYVGLLPVQLGRQRIGLVSWVPHSGLPSYPEVRWTVQRRLPHAIGKPRLEHPGRPEFETIAQPVDNTILTAGVSFEKADWTDMLGDLELDQSEFNNRVEEIRSDTKAHGFDAIAWFQPYHLWTEETWGIYFDARKLDNLALSILDDFKAQRIRGSHSAAALLAFGLVYAHELFHARAEAALSWMEINALQPRHLRYKKRVYDALRETPDWLEEALANWSAWDWFRSPAVAAVFAQHVAAVDNLRRVVEASLDFSPPGYRDWRVGHEPETWRAFSTQLSTANPRMPFPGIGLPIESILTGPLPYDLLPSDIPVRFVGRGVIADRIQSHPATFNVPSRRELEKALKYFKHILDVSGGKGGHQKWTGPDQRAFILPTRDPVSLKVFKSFLHYLGLDKATYVSEVRPNL